MFLTRIGANAKAIITGDLTQIDLPKNQRSGLEKAARILRNIDGIAHIELDEEDVVRHRLVKAIIRAYDRDHRENGDVHPQQHWRDKVQKFDKKERSDDKKESE
jgi:phosphate starvation-inducible PhoH-like protein